MNLFPLVVIFQVKHLLADYPFQTDYMLGKFKKTGWVEPLAVHSAVHAVFTMLICFFAGADRETMLLLAGFNGAVHFVMDRIKADPDLLGRFKPLSGSEMKDVLATLERDNVFATELRWAKERYWGNKFFWWSLGLDQYVHHITDILCAAALAGALN